MAAMTRRTFLARSAAGAAAGALAGSARSAEQVKGANQRVNMALIGCGGRGGYVARGLIEAGVRITCLCDLHEGRLRQAAKFIGQVQKTPPKHTTRIREVLDSKDVDAVIVATPDHWHAPASILACQAGKDVYCEKPHCHNIWEGKQMVAAARKYKRVLQVGTQNRSGAYNLAALEFVKSGQLGPIHLVKVYNLKPGGPIKLGKPGEKPKGLDWDAWLGPAPDRPWHQKIFYGGWKRMWDFSAGDMGDDGIHQIDLALMLMGDPPPPKTVAAVGGRLAHKGDDGEVPDVQVVQYGFETFVMTFELTGYPRYMRKTTGTIRRKDIFPYWTQNATRIELYGSKMMMTVGRHGGGWQVTTSGGKVFKQMYGRVPEAEHFKNFLECLKTRKRPNADVGIAQRSAAIMHMGNIAHRIGNQSLRVDAKTGRFVDNDAANKLIKRTYRKKYEIPETV